MPIDNNIQLLRDFLGLTQIKFAELLGVTRGMIRDYETGKSKPKHMVMDKILQLFDLELSLLDNSTLKMTEVTRPSEGLIGTLSIHGQIQHLITQEKEVDRRVYRLLKLDQDNETVSKIELLRNQLVEIRQSVSNLQNEFLNLMKPVLGFAGLRLNDAAILTQFDFFQIIELFKSKNLDGLANSKSSRNFVSLIRKKSSMLLPLLSNITEISIERLRDIEEENVVPERHELEILQIVNDRIDDLRKDGEHKKDDREIFQIIRLALLIKRLRAKYYLSEKELANRVELNEEDIKVIESGFFSVDDYRLQKLFNYFDLKLKVLTLDTIEPISKSFNNALPGYEGSKIEMSNIRITSFTKPFKQFIDNGNFRLFEKRIESEYGEFAENYLGERAINKDPFDFFAYVIILEDNEEVFGFVKKINREKWIVKEFKADDNPLRNIDPKRVKELWILRKFFMLHDVKPQIFDVNENADELSQDQNKQS